MTSIVFPVGEPLSRPFGEFVFFHSGNPILDMEPVETTRRARLQMLARRFDGLANLCEKMGLSRKETSGLSRIANANVRHDRNGELYVMGSPTARKIEKKLGLEEGWMDTPPTYEELDPDPLLSNLMQVARTLREDNRNDELVRLVAIGNTLVELPAKRSNGE